MRKILLNLFTRLFEHLFNIPFPEFEYPPALNDDMLPFNDITAIYSNFDKPWHDQCFGISFPKAQPSLNRLGLGSTLARKTTRILSEELITVATMYHSHERLF